jgi:hypothetical protein
MAASGCPRTVLIRVEAGAGSLWLAGRDEPEVSPSISPDAGYRIQASLHSGSTGLQLKRLVGRQDAEGGF